MEVQKGNGYCLLCWNNFQNHIPNSVEENWISVSSLSEKHFEIWKKYLNFEIHENMTRSPRTLLCTVCRESTGKLYELNGQLEEIENVIYQFASQISEMVKKSREEKVIIRNIENDNLIIDSCFAQDTQLTVSTTELNLGEKDAPNVANENNRNRSDITHTHGKCEEENGLRVPKIEPPEEEECIETRPKKEVRVQLERLKFKLNAGMTSTSNATVLVISNSLRRTTEISRQICDDINDDDDDENFTDMDDRGMEENVPNRNETGSNTFTVSYRCSRCHKISSDLFTMEQHIRVHERRDSEYWLKNLKFLKRCQSIRRRANYM